MCPRNRRTRVWLTLALVPVCAVSAAACGSGGGDKPRARSGAATAAPAGTTTTTAPAPNLRAVPLRSTYETRDRIISRDGGISVALPDGTSLWLFGDTGVFERDLATGQLESTEFIDGSTAMRAKTADAIVPTGIELPAGAPARFLPVPDNVYLPDGSGRPCNYDTAAFAARWPIGAAQFDPDHVIVTYSIVCVSQADGAAAAQAEGWGYLLYNWKTHAFDHGPDDVFAPSPSGTRYPSSRLFVSPGVAQGQVTFFSSQCLTMNIVLCAEGGVWSTSMPATVAALSDPASYQSKPIATDGASTWGPLSVSVGRYPEGLRLVESSTIVGG
jgi:hypothetical protein